MCLISHSWLMNGLKPGPRHLGLTTRSLHLAAQNCRMTCNPRQSSMANCLFFLPFFAFSFSFLGNTTASDGTSHLFERSLGLLSPFLFTPFFCSVWQRGYLVWALPSKYVYLALNTKFPNPPLLIETLGFYILNHYLGYNGSGLVGSGQ